MGCGGSKEEEAPDAGTSDGAPSGGGGGGKAAPKGSTELDVSERNLAELDLNELVSHLQKIVASDNKLTALPKEIGNCSELTSLDVSGNELTTLPEEISSCSALEELLCYKNQIKALPEALDGKHMPKLTTLNLFNNKLRKLPNPLGTLSTLEEVNVAANKLMMVDAIAMAGWTNVKILNMYDNNLVRFGSCEPLVSLTEVRLYGNNLEEMPVFSSVPELEILEMHKNRVASVPDDYFKAMPQLKRLVLSNNQLTSLPESIGSCTELKQLQLQENKLTSLASLPSSLETLFVQQNAELTSLPEGLSECAKMLRCNLGGTKIPTGGVCDTLKKVCTSQKGGVYWAPDGAQTNAPNA